MVASVCASAACVYLRCKAEPHAGAKFLQEGYEPCETARYQGVAKFHLLDHNCVRNSDRRFGAAEKAMDVYDIEDSKDDNASDLSA